MKTPYARALQMACLTLSEASVLHGVPYSTIANWTTGKVDPPPEAWEQLRARWSVIPGNAGMPDVAEAFRILSGGNDE